MYIIPEDSSQPLGLFPGRQQMFSIYTKQLDWRMAKLG